MNIFFVIILIQTFPMWPLPLFTLMQLFSSSQSNGHLFIRLYIYLWCIFLVVYNGYETSLKRTCDLSMLDFFWNKHTRTIKSASPKIPSSAQNCCRTNHYNCVSPDVLWPAASLTASSQLLLYQATIERWAFSHIKGRWLWIFVEAAVCLWAGHTVKIICVSLHVCVGVWGNASSKFGLFAL